FNKVRILPSVNRPYRRRLLFNKVRILPLDSRAGPRIVGQRSLVSQDRAWPNQSRPADVTAASDDCILHLRGGADARVTPNHRIFDPRALFNVTTFAQN